MVLKINVIRTIIVVAVWLALSICCFFKQSDKASESERRYLSQFPEMSVEGILDGTFMTDFEKYTLDQFPMRDTFRTFKAMACYYGFLQKDNNGIYVADGYAAALEYPMNEKMILGATDKMKYLYNKYVEGNCENVYITVIPDKNCFLADKHGYLSMDYAKVFELVKDNTNFAEYIDIVDGVLDVSDYYKTDTHWRQECLVDVANKLSLGMNMGAVTKDKFEVLEADTDFYGVYYGQAALPMKSEKIFYLTNSILEKCEVYNYETDKVTQIYDMDKMNSRDPYEMFLSGAAALLTIENKNATTDKELVVFRDSFGSSIIPLIAEQYTKITLIDTRYIASDLIENYVEFNGQDVLFMYSTILLNNSMTMK
ncbi:MAG: hypothetical protein E7266_08185 [Lachnospiraceae bacterium]|nr:hypothetical protein [Lachnospiraceae bacterium]